MWRLLLSIATLLCLLSPSYGQEADSVPAPVPARKGSITPVDIDNQAPPKPVLHYYDEHGNPLKEPVRFLLTTDTVQKVKPGPAYPLYNGINVGVNFFDAVLLAAGQKYASFDLWANVSLHNWFFPTVEAGLGYGNYSPESGKYKYHSRLSPYFKLGIDYNFLYKSNPDYRFFLGLRAGLSRYSYDITDIKVSSTEEAHELPDSFTNQHSTTLYGEALAGLQVKLYRRLSAGWSIRYRFGGKTWPREMPEDCPIDKPWFVPGYGAGSHIAFTFSLIFRI